MEPKKPLVAAAWTADAAERLDSAMRSRAGLSGRRSRIAVATGKVKVNGKVVLDPAAPVKPGDAIAVDPGAPNPAKVQPHGVRVVFRDDHLIIVEKPPMMNTAPVPDSEDPTVLHAVIKLCRGGRPPKVVHRIDRETSGLLMFARGAQVARALRPMFDAHEIRRVYRCVVEGVPKPDAALLSSMMVRDAGHGKRGSREGTFKIRPLRTPDPGPMPGFGKLAITRYETMAVAGTRAALEVRPSTGRTHQIRVHLAELGSPILGEHVYARVGGAPRLALHAAVIGFTHPVTGKPLSFESPWPEDLADVRPLGKDW
jgi:23S rRNA pseudouridine1911/1915/1917 synthase